MDDVIKRAFEIVENEQIDDVDSITKNLKNDKGKQCVIIYFEKGTTIGLILSLIVAIVEITRNYIINRNHNDSFYFQIKALTISS